MPKRICFSSFLTKTGVLLFIITCFALSGFYVSAYAQDDTEKLKDLQKQIEEYEHKITEAQGTQKTLATAIDVLNNQIFLTVARITKTKEEMTKLEVEIEGLSKKIVQLDQDLNKTSKDLDARIQETYKRSFLPPVYLLFSSSGFSDFFQRLKYAQTIQRHDKEIMFAMEEAKQNFDNQKQLKETKQQELSKLEVLLNKQNTTLAQQKASKEELLRVTKNDEQNFQSLLAKAKAEFQAIQSILAGNGSETKVSDVKEGDSIASIISGQSACSSGTHLHFEVVKNKAHTNPASWLSSRDVDWDLCGWYGCDDPFSFTGSWRWPLEGKPRITQGYGMTAYAKNAKAYGGGPHTGIDMVSSDLTVKAVKDGELYRGSIACGGGTLRYVRVKHKDGEADTYYLHINYTK